MKRVAVIGAGPAGLMAAQVMSQAGVAVTVFDAMPSVGRKFLMAGKGGLNLTHSEPLALFLSRFGARENVLAPMLSAWGPQAVRDWVADLGFDTFVGSSGRVFPSDMKAAPLLRAWLHRLRHPQRGEPVQFVMRHRWRSEDSLPKHPLELQFTGPGGLRTEHPDAVVLALGGASWARLGSDGRWWCGLQARGVMLAPFQPSNCGFDVLGGWSGYFRDRFAGQAFKSVALTVRGANTVLFRRKGEFVATATGVEGSLIYAASSLLRDQLHLSGTCCFELDLLPDRSGPWVLEQVSHPRGTRSLSSHLKSRLALDALKIALLHEKLAPADLHQPTSLARAIKALPMTLQATRPLDEAISTAGGVMFDAMNQRLMLKAWPGVFCAGEMLDWEAPTGGYLLTACLSSGAWAGSGVLRFLNENGL